MTAKIIQLNAVSERFERLSRELESEDTCSNTKQAYETAVRAYEDFCITHNLALCEASLRYYLIYLERDLGRAVSTIRQHYSGVIAWDPSLKSASVERVMRSISKRHALDPINKKKALTRELAERILSKLPANTVRELRDRALVTTAWVTASRKFELLGLDVSHIVSTDSGYALRVLLKGASEPIVKYINEDFILDAHSNLTAWLDVVGDSGPLWCRVRRGDNIDRTKRLSPSGFDSIFKRLLALAAIDPREYSPHCIRHGFITHEANKGTSLAKVQAVTGHKSVESIKHYWDQAELLKSHPMSGDNNQ